MDQAERLRRNDIGKTKRLDLDHIKSPHSLVPMREVADLFVAEEAAKKRQQDSRDPDARSPDARLEFYKCLAGAVARRDFEGRSRLFVVDGVVVRWDRRAAAFIGKPPPDDSPDGEHSAYWKEIIAEYWSKTWASNKVASTWCRKNRFSVPPRWTPAKPKRTGGRPPKVESSAIATAVCELMDRHGEFNNAKRQWNAQARLEDAVRSRIGNKLGESQLRKLVAEALSDWRLAQDRTKANN